MKIKFNIIKSFTTVLFISICGIQVIGQNPNNCYAILLNGGMDTSYNYSGHYNSLKFAYETLVNKYNYLDDHIYVLNSDGTDTGDDIFKYVPDDPYYEVYSSPQDIDGDNDNDITEACVEQEIIDLIADLRSVITKNDFLLIYLTGANEYLYSNLYYLWDNPYITSYDYITDNDLVNYFDQLNAGITLVVTAYTKSGSIVDNFEDTGRVIQANCGSDEFVFWVGDDYYTQYEEYTYYFFSALGGENPDGDPVDANSNDDDYITIEEAHNYAVLNRESGNSTFRSSTPDNLWKNLTILGEELCVSILNIHDKVYYGETVYIEDCYFDLEDVWIVLNSDLHLVSEHDIVFQGTLVGDNSDLIIEAGGSVNIESDFEIELGSTLRIN